MLLGVRLTVTEATAIVVTVTSTEPVLVSDVAVMAVVPIPVAVTSPLESMVATEELDDDQVMLRPERILPLASRRTAAAIIV